MAAFWDDTPGKFKAEAKDANEWGAAMKGTLTFRADIGGYEPVVFDTMAVQPEDPTIAAVHVIAEDGNPARISVTVEFDNAPSEEAAMLVAKVEARRILSRISFEYDVSISEPGLPETHFELTTPAGKAIIQGTLSHSVSAFISGKQPRELDESQKRQLRTFLDSPTTTRDSRYNDLRNINISKDVVEKFMFLYAFLLQEKGPGQSGVDAFIRIEEPGVREEPSTNPHARAGAMETIYTKLRNEIGHVCPGRTLENTRQDMEKYLPHLLRLAKNAII